VSSQYAQKLALVKEAFMFAKIILRTLWCGKTTERGHDEIYFIVAAQNGDGTTYTKLLPDGDGDADGGRAWDCNDGEGDPKKDRILRYPLYQYPLNVGQTCAVKIVVMESDGTDYNEAAQAAGTLLGTIQDPIAMAVGAVASIAGHAHLLPSNENDCLGGVSFVLTNRNGTLEWTYGVSATDPQHVPYAFYDPNDGVSTGLNSGQVKNGLFQHQRNVDGGDGGYFVYYNILLTQ
jgi:hypothetical protein